MGVTTTVLDVVFDVMAGEDKAVKNLRLKRS
jgi:hypothetical protein